MQRFNKRVVDFNKPRSGWTVIWPGFDTVVKWPNGELTSYEPSDLKEVKYKSTSYYEVKR